MKLIFIFAFAFSSNSLAISIPPSDSPLFQSTKTVTATLTADFTALWKKRHVLPLAGALGDFTPEAFVTGTLVYKDNNNNDSSALPVEIRVRGNSSRDDCEFPKLRLEFGKTVLTGTIFDGASSVKIGTHCADVEGNSGRYQRLRNQKEPHREVAAYEILELLGVPSFKARTAIITYVDMGNNNLVTKRAAMFLESPNEFKKRFKAEEIFVQGSAEAKAAEADAAKQAVKNGTKVPTPVYFTDASASLDPSVNEAEMVNAIFAESLLGNVDWDLRIKGKTNLGFDLWNIKAYLLPDATKIIVPYDFDLARLAINPGGTEMQDNIALYLRRAQDGFNDQLYQQTDAFYNSQRKAIENIIDQNDLTFPSMKTGEIVDDPGAKSLMKNFLSYFWKLI